MNMNSSARAFWGSVENSRPGIIDDVWEERKRQITKWGPQTHPDGTDSEEWAPAVLFAKAECDEANEAGSVTWLQILEEEVCEAFAETDPVKLRAELVQSAAVIAAWIEDLDAREAA